MASRQVSGQQIADETLSSSTAITFMEPNFSEGREEVEFYKDDAGGVTLADISDNKAETIVGETEGATIYGIKNRAGTEERTSVSLGKNDNTEGHSAVLGEFAVPRQALILSTPEDLACPLEGSQVDESIVCVTSKMLSELEPQNTLKDTCSEPICIQRVVHRHSIDDNFPEVDLSQFREVDYDELHRHKSVADSPTYMSPRSVRHATDVSSIDHSPVEVEELCVQRIVSNLTSPQQPQQLDSKDNQDCTQDIGSNLHSELFLEASVATMTDKFLTEERKMADVHPKIICDPGKTFSCVQEVGTVSKTFYGEEQVKVFKTTSENEKNFIQKQTDESIEGAKFNPTPRQVAAHEYDVTVIEQIDTPINLSFSEPSQSYRSNEKEIPGESKGDLKAGEPNIIGSDEVSVVETVESLLTTQHAAQDSRQSASSHEFHRVVTSDTVEIDTIYGKRPDYSDDQHVLKPTHIISRSELTTSDEAQSSTDSANKLTSNTKASVVVTAPCMESVDLVESCSLRSPKGTDVQSREGHAFYGEVLDESTSGTLVEGKFMGDIAVCIDSTVEEVSSDVTDISMTTVSDAVETGSSFELSDTSIERDSLPCGETKLVADCKTQPGAAARTEILEEIMTVSKISVGPEREEPEDEDLSALNSERPDVLSPGPPLTSVDKGKLRDDTMDLTFGDSHSSETANRCVRGQSIREEHLIRDSKKKRESYNSQTTSKTTRKDAASTVTRLSRVENKPKLGDRSAAGSSESKATSTVRYTTQRFTTESQRRPGTSRGRERSSATAAVSNVTSAQTKARDTFEQKKTEYHSSQTTSFNYMRTTVSREAKRSKDSQDSSEKLSNSQKSSKEGTPTRKTPLTYQKARLDSATHHAQSEQLKEEQLKKDSVEHKKKQGSAQKSSFEGTLPTSKISTKQTSKVLNTSRTPSVSSTSSSNRRVSESSSASSTKSITRSRVEHVPHTQPLSSTRVTKELSQRSGGTKTSAVSQIPSPNVSRNTVSSVTVSTVRKAVAITEPSKIKRKERKTIPTSMSSMTKPMPSKAPSHNIDKITSQESVPSTFTGEDIEFTEPDCVSLIQDDAESFGIFSPSVEGVSRRASSAPIPSTKEPLLHSLHPRLQTSLPSSPSRLARAGNHGLVTQLLTSEVFTRTVESTDAVEVVYHQPERQRRPTDGDQSFIDTTDSSLSESTAIPSSSTSSDRRRSRSASPKATKRSDVISSVDTSETGETAPPPHIHQK